MPDSGVLATVPHRVIPAPSSHSRQSQDDQTDETLQCHEDMMQYIISMMHVNIFKYAIF
jgi:hypothetical protein